LASFVRSYRWEGESVLSPELQGEDLPPDTVDVDSIARDAAGSAVLTTAKGDAVFIDGLTRLILPLGEHTARPTRQLPGGDRSN
jgi:hypothetical protein